MSEKIDRKRAAKRQAIFDAAAARFAREGYANTRMADIAHDLGLQKAALYYYFDSKEALLVDLIEERVGEALESLQEIAESGSSAGDRVASAVASHLEVFHRQADVYTIYNSERLHLIDPGTAEKVDSLGREYERLWSRMIAEGVADGVFRDGIDVAVTVKAILGMLNTTLQWYRPEGRLDVASLGDRYVDLTLAMLTD